MSQKKYFVKFIILFLKTLPKEEKDCKTYFVKLRNFCEHEVNHIQEAQDRAKEIVSNG